MPKSRHFVQSLHSGLVDGLAALAAELLEPHWLATAQLMRLMAHTQVNGGQPSFVFQ